MAGSVRACLGLVRQFRHVQIWFIMARLGMAVTAFPGAFRQGGVWCCSVWFGSYGGSQYGGASWGKARYGLVWQARYGGVCYGELG